MRVRDTHILWVNCIWLTKSTFISQFHFYFILLKHYASRVDTLEFLFEFWPFILTTRRQIEKGRGGDGNKSEQV